MVNQYYRRLNRSVSFALLLFTGLSIVTAVIQVFMYGFSLNNIAIAVGAALFYVFALRDLNREVARSRKLEIERYKKEREREHILFERADQRMYDRKGVLKAMA